MTTVPGPSFLNLRLLGAAALGCCVLTAQAGSVAVEASVKDVRAGEAGRVTLTTVEALINPAGCAGTSYYEMAADESRNPKLALLLMAQAGNRTVRLEIDDAACGPYGRPIVNFVTIKK